MRSRIVIFLVCLGAALALAAPAFAQTSSPTDETYGGVPGNEIRKSDPSGKGGSLPFSGSELWLVALAGAGLAGAGIALRRSTRAGT